MLADRGGWGGGGHGSLIRFDHLTFENGLFKKKRKEKAYCSR